MSTSIFLETAKHERPNIYVAGTGYFQLKEVRSAKVIFGDKHVLHLVDEYFAMFPSKVFCQAADEDKETTDSCN